MWRRDTRPGTTGRRSVQLPTSARSKRGLLETRDARHLNGQELRQPEQGSTAGSSSGLSGRATAGPEKLRNFAGRCRKSHTAIAPTGTLVFSSLPGGTTAAPLKDLGRYREGCRDNSSPRGVGVDSCSTQPGLRVRPQSLAVLIAHEPIVLDDRRRADVHLIGRRKGPGRRYPHPSERQHSRYSAVSRRGRHAPNAAD
jgi:hypothetical protein